MNIENTKRFIEKYGYKVKYNGIEYYVAFKKAGIFWEVFVYDSDYKLLSSNEDIYTNKGLMAKTAIMYYLKNKRAEEYNKNIDSVFEVGDVVNLDELSIIKN